MWTAVVRIVPSQDRRSLKTRTDAGALRIADALSDLQVCDIGPDEVAPFDPDGRLLTNVNTPGDYERARRAADGVPRSA